MSAARKGWEKKWEWPGHTTDQKPVPQRSWQQPGECAINQSSFLYLQIDLEEHRYYSEKWKRCQYCPRALLCCVSCGPYVEGHGVEYCPSYCVLSFWQHQNVLAQNCQGQRGLVLRLRCRWGRDWQPQVGLKCGAGLWAGWREHRGRLGRGSHGWQCPQGPDKNCFGQAFRFAFIVHEFIYQHKGFVVDINGWASVT